MKIKIILWIIGIVIGFIIIGSFIPDKDIKDSSILIDQEDSISESEFSSQENNLTNNTSTQENQEAVTNKNYYLVTRVIDGDTIEIETGERVRLICIDTPETGEPYYNEATDYLKSLVLNKKVLLEKDISETDKYGRLLRHIYLENGDFVNELIVLNGYGQAYPYNPDITLCPQIETAEDIARNKVIGIWEIIEEETTSSGYVCSYNYYNCGDFSSYSEALVVFEACGGVSNDVHKLDGDNDGEPCESLK